MSEDSDKYADCLLDFLVSQKIITVDQSKLMLSPLRLTLHNYSNDIFAAVDSAVSSLEKRVGIAQTPNTTSN